MVVSLEKRILVAIVGLSAVLAVGGTIVFTQKRAIQVEAAKEGGGVPSAENVLDTAAPSGPDETASSAIAVGKAKQAPANGEYKEITWEQLYELDYKTGKMPPSLKKLHKAKVRIPGFIVPLSDDLRVLKEYLLVPNAQACIHVPAPPPNLIVYSILEKAIPMAEVANPSWIEGTLTIEKTESEYGAAGYKMIVDRMVEYKF